MWAAPHGRTNTAEDPQVSEALLFSAKRLEGNRQKLIVADNAGGYGRVPACTSELTATAEISKRARRRCQVIFSGVSTMEVDKSDYGKR